MLSEGYHAFFNTSNVAIKCLAQQQGTCFFLRLKQPILPYFLHKTGPQTTKSADDPLMTYITGKLTNARKVWHPCWGG